MKKFGNHHFFLRFDKETEIHVFREITVGISNSVLLSCLIFQIL